MKKTLSLIIAIVMVAAMAVFPVSAASADLYVKAGGTGDGSSESNAFGSLTDAYNAAAAMTEDVTIHVVGTLDIQMAESVGSADTFIAPEHANTITITGGKLNDIQPKGWFWVLGGKTVIDNTEIATANGIFFITDFYDFTVGTGVTTTGKISVGATAANSSRHLDIFTKTYTGNARITLLSGTYGDVSIMRQNSKGVVINGSSIITIGGTAVVDNLVTARNMLATIENSTIILDGGKVNRFVGNCDRAAANLTAPTYVSGATGTFKVIVTKNFKIADSFNQENGSTFFGISGVTAATIAEADQETLIGKAEYILQIAPEVYDEVTAAADKVQTISFDSVVNKTHTAEDEQLPEIEPPVTEPPATEPPVSDTQPDDETKPDETTEPASSGTTPSGDVTTSGTSSSQEPSSSPVMLIVGIATVVVVIAAVVIIVVAKKKKK